eukprot:TRINITY_DN3058_c0_g1_i1.p2 TRINITY_DN3058_c0_g1~~TRINITY_DN3058_c0_g1_i1.p2  ORF type:complete len:263 (-),score=73.64 TRINITY_DN3058_c0_g1_i1:91-879(-)
MMKATLLVVLVALLCHGAAASVETKEVFDVPMDQMPKDDDPADVAPGVGDKAASMDKVKAMKAKLRAMRDEVESLNAELKGLTKAHAKAGRKIPGMPIEGDVLVSSPYGSDTTYLPRNFQVGGQFIRKISRYQNLYVHDGRQYGQLSGRSLYFNKLRADTALKVTWTDNFRIYISGGWCHWQILFNHRSCPSGALNYAKYAGGTYYTNHHEPGTATGVCRGLPAGRHYISTHVYRYGGYCWTGWYTLSNLEVEEVFPDSMPR